MIVLRPDDYEAYPRSARTGSNDVARQRWSEVQEQALPGANRIEPPDALKALAHRLHANVGKSLPVGF